MIVLRQDELSNTFPINLFKKKIKFKKLKYTATILMLLLIWGISVKFSEGYFYPYPAYTTKIEVGDYNE